MSRRPDRADRNDREISATSAGGGVACMVPRSARRTGAHDWDATDGDRALPVPSRPWRLADRSGERAPAATAATARRRGADGFGVHVDIGPSRRSQARETDVAGDQGSGHRSESERPPPGGRFAGPTRTGAWARHGAALAPSEHPSTRSSARGAGARRPGHAPADAGRSRLRSAVLHVHRGQQRGPGSHQLCRRARGRHALGRDRLPSLGRWLRERRSQTPRPRVVRAADSEQPDLLRPQTSADVNCHAASNFAGGIGNQVTVTASQPFTFMTPFIGDVFGGTLTSPASIAPRPMLNPPDTTILAASDPVFGSTPTPTPTPRLRRRPTRPLPPGRDADAHADTTPTPSPTPVSDLHGPGLLSHVLEQSSALNTWHNISGFTGTLTTRATARRSRFRRSSPVSRSRAAPT